MTDFQQTGLPTGLLASDEGAELVRPATAIAFTEGPAAHADGRVFFSDIANNRIMCFDPRQGTTVVWRHPSGRANGLLFDVGGQLLICEGNEWGDNDGGRRICRADVDAGTYEVLTDQYQGRRYNAPNDIAAGSNGLIYFTDPCYGDRSTMELDHESVYRIDPDGRVSVVLSQPRIQRPNGIALSPDEQTLYVVDSCPVIGGNRCIWAFELDSQGEVGQGRVVIDFAPGRGGDGMAVDQDGNLLIAAGIHRPRGPHESADVPPGIWIVSPAGEVLGRIPVVEDVLTNVTFGGSDLKTLYITAGKTLFQCRVNVPGFVVHRGYR